MGTKKPQPHRSFTPEFAAKIVELCQRGDRSVGQVARDFDLTTTAVRGWVKQAGRDFRRCRRPLRVRWAAVQDVVAQGLGLGFGEVASRASSLGQASKVATAS